MAGPETLATRAARLLREDAQKYLSGQMWNAKRECENEGGSDPKVCVAHAEKAVTILTNALSEYASACTYADKIAGREAK